MLSTAEAAGGGDRGGVGGLVHSTSHARRTHGSRMHAIYYIATHLAPGISPQDQYTA